MVVKCTNLVNTPNGNVPTRKCVSILVWLLTKTNENWLIIFIMIICIRCYYSIVDVVHMNPAWSVPLLNSLHIRTFVWLVWWQQAAMPFQGCRKKNKQIFHHQSQWSIWFMFNLGNLQRLNICLSTILIALFYMWPCRWFLVLIRFCIFFSEFLLQVLCIRQWHLNECYVYAGICPFTNRQCCRFVSDKLTIEIVCRTRCVSRWL